MKVMLDFKKFTEVTQDMPKIYLRYAFGLNPNASAFSSVITRQADAPSV